MHSVGMLRGAGKLAADLFESKRGRKCGPGAGRTLGSNPPPMRRRSGDDSGSVADDSNSAEVSTPARSWSTRDIVSCSNSVSPH